MAGNVDTRVIQMQFDNREFEKNIAKSQKSIEDLKEAMDFEETSRGLERFADSTKVLGFDSLANNVEKLMNKFTGLGTVSEYVLSRIRSLAEGAALSIERFVRSISFDQIATGQSKYDQLNKAVMTIVSGGIASEKDAYEVMERVSKYTDQTSHNFETMVARISDLTSRGMGLEEAELLIEGMGNAATYAGQGANEAAMSMNVLSKVLSGQFLGYEQFLQLSNTAKVITSQWREQAVKAGLAVGTLVEKQGKFYTNVKGQKAVEVSASNLENTLRNRWLTSEVVKKIYENYEFGDTVADLAHPDDAIIKSLDESKEAIGKKMQELFPDSNVDLLKRKVVKMGDDVATVLTQTFTASKDGSEGLMWNQDLVMNITPITPEGEVLDDNTVNQYVEDLLKKSTNIKDLYKYDKKANGGRGLLISADVDFESFEKGISDAEGLAKELHELQAEYYKDANGIKSINTEFGRTAFLTGQRALTLADAINAIKESVSSGWMQTFRYIFGDVTEAAEHFTNICDRILDSLGRIKDFRNEVLRLWAQTGNARQNLFALFLGDYEDGVRSGVVGIMDLLDGLGDIVWKGLMDFFSLFADPVERANFKDNPGHFKAWLAKHLELLVTGAQNFLKSIKDFFDADITVGGETKSRLEVIHEIVQGIAGALKLAYDMLGGVIYFIEKVAAQLTPSFDAIIDFLGKLGIEIYKTAEETGDAHTIKRFFDDLATTIKPVTDGINSVITSLTKFLSLILGLDNESKDRTEGLTKVGNVLLSLADIIAKIVGPILNFVSSIIDAFTELLSGEITPERFKTFGKQLSDAFKTMMTSFADNLPDSFGFLGNWIRDLFGLWEDGTEHESNSFFAFLHKLFTGKFGNLGELLTSFSQGFNLKDALESGFGFISAWNFLGQIIGFFKGTNLYGVIMAFLGVATLAGLLSLIHKAKKGVAVVTGFFSDVGGNIRNFATNVKQGFLGDYEWFGERILNIAKAIAILVACVAVLGSMDSGSMKQGIIGVVVMMGAIAGLFFIFTKLKAGYMQQTAAAALISAITAAIVAITVGLSILSLAILPLASDWNKTAAAIVGLIGMLAAIGGFIVLMIAAIKKFLGFDKGLGGIKSWNKIGQLAAIIALISVAILAISASIGALAVALTPLASTGWGGMLRAIIAFAAFLAIFGGFMMIMINALDTLAFKIGGGKGWAGYGKMALSMIALAASISLIALSVGALVVAITPFSLMSWGGFVRAVAGLGIVLLELSLMIKYITNLSSDDKKATLKIAGFAAFAASIGILIMALTPLALMTWNAWGRAMLGLTVVLAELLAVMYIVKKFDIGTGKLLGFAGFAASLGILIFSLTPFASMEWDGLARAMVGLAGVLIEMIATMYIIKRMKLDVSTLGSFIAFAASIALIIFAIKPLADMSPQGYQQALIGLATVMLEIVVLLGIINEIKPDLKSAGSTLLMLVGLGVAMVLFSIAFNEVRDVPWQNILAFAGGIALMIAAIGLTATLSKGLSIKGILMISLALAAILGVLALMIPLLTGSIGGAMSSLASRLAMFSQLMSIFSSNMSNVDDGSVDKAITAVKKIASLFEVIIGFRTREGDIKAFSLSVSRMSLVADQLVNFQDKANTLDLTAIDNAKEVLTRIKDLLENEVSSITGYSNIASLFSTAMYNLGTGIEIFNNHTGDIGNVEENSAIQLIQALSGCADDMNTIYKMNIDSLTSKLSGLGGALMLYAQGAKESQGVTGFDPTDQESISSVTSAVELLKAISSSIGGEGGFTIPTNMPTEEALGTFGAQLAALAGALIQFESAGAGLGEGKDKALEVLTFFEQLKEQLISTNFTSNVVASMDAFKDANGVLIQQNELETFGKNIEQLGLSLKEFAQATTVVDESSGEIKPVDYTKATEALQSIVDVGNKLPSVGGAVEIIIGRRQKLESLATELNLLGSAMGDFHKNTSTFDEVNNTIEPYDFTNAIAFLNSVGDLETKLPKVNGFNLESLFTKENMSFADLGAQLGELGAGLNTMCKSIVGEDENGNKKFDADIASQATSLISDHVIPTMSALAKDLPKVGGIGKFFSTIANGRETNFEDVAKVMEQLGTGLAGLGKGISGGGFENNTAVENAFNALESVFGAMVRIQELLVESNSLFDSQYFGMESFSIFKRLSELLTYMSEGIDEEHSITGEAYSPIVGQIQNFVKSLNEAFSELSTTADGAEAIQGRMNIFKTFAEGLNALTNTNYAADWTKIGTKLVDEVAKGISDGVTTITNAIKNDIIKAYNEAQNVEGVSWTVLGENIAAGIAVGMTDSISLGQVIGAAATLVITAFDSACATANSHSPSLLFAQLGDYLGQGLSVGMLDSERNVASAASEMTGVAIDKASDVIGLISRIMAEDVDANPTISPVLDLTNLESGLDQFARDAQGRQIALNTSGISLTAGSIGLTGGSFDMNQLKPDYNGLYARMDALGQQVNNLGTAISKIKIVLNSGVVAGSVTDDVDRNLGRKIFYAGRNN